jgi:adenine-specific DNA-methyltransferase
LGDKLSAVLPYMSSQKFKLTLETLLKQDKRLVDENAELKLALIRELIDKNDETLIALLLKDPETKKKFFLKVGDVSIFKQNDLKFFLDSNQLDNSYTAYANKIGLSNGTRLLREGSDVVLNFPFKDCVLEGGQRSEDGTDTFYEAEGSEYSIKRAKRKEIFFNEILGQDEIDRLTEPKAFVNFKRYSNKGDNTFSGFTKKNGAIKDNLIIKGNNLLALHSLKPLFAGKVKLIYIDPPYNTGNDSFAYNDKFNHSTWLTFMKNRLEIARELLTPDGSIYVQLDYNEVHYCKVLMDEIFGKENFQREIIWRIGWVSGYKTAIKNWIRNHDTILFYTNKELFFNKEYIPYPEGYKRRDGALPDGKGFPIEDTWNCSENDIMNSIQLESFNTEKTGFFTQKNEALLQRIIKSATNEGDLVLDFCSGSGTTAATAHKLNRQYIAIEQMDEQMEIMKERISKVIAGDPKGISRSVGWKGGGSFVYMELKKWNEEAKDLISACKDLKELTKLLDLLADNYFLNYNVRFQEFRDEIIGEKGFSSLPLKKQKEMCAQMLDLNQLYVNYSEMQDRKYGISKQDISFTKEFYS